MAQGATPHVEKPAYVIVSSNTQEKQPGISNPVPLYLPAAAKLT
jgi:hypothetical protein